MKYEIEKNIPAPNEHDYRGGRKIYPLPEMDIGDSFFVPFGEKDQKKLANSILGCARKDRHKGKKFTTRTDVNGVRCWRIK